MIGDLGGYLELLNLIGLILTLNYVKNAYERSLMGDTYQMQKYNETTKEFYPSQALRKGLKTNKEHDL